VDKLPAMGAAHFPMNAPQSNITLGAKPSSRMCINRSLQVGIPDITTAFGFF